MNLWRSQAAALAPERIADIFWGEIPPCEHLVQLYSDDAAFLDLLVNFVAGGLAGGESVILLATREHIAALDARLGARDLDIAAAREREHYITIDAESALAGFMVDGWPDDERFERFVVELLQRARHGGRRVRAFGELVALLWAQGNSGATVRLEHLWHRICHEHGFPLLCAYPRTGFLQGPADAARAICAAHSHTLPEVGRAHALAG